MSKNWPHRPPAVFRLDDDHVMVGLAKDDAAKRAVQVIPEPDTETSVIAVDDPLQWPRRRFRWGVDILGRLGRLDPARRRSRGGSPDRGSVRAQPGIRLSRLGARHPGRSRVLGRCRSRDHGSGAARDHREAASARLGHPPARRSAGRPGGCARSPCADAPHAAAGAQPRHHGKSSRRYHRRRRPGALYRARADDAAGSAGAPHRHRGGNAGVGLYCDKPARRHRRIVRVRLGAGSGAPAVLAVRGATGCARPGAADAARGRCIWR